MENKASLCTSQYVRSDLLHILKYYFECKETETFLEFIGQILLGLGVGETRWYLHEPGLLIAGPFRLC